MAPSINPDAHETGRRDTVFVRPYLARIIPRDRDAEEGWEGNINRGDVVMFWKPHKPEECGIKRVVALEGDTVYVKRGYALDKEVLETARLAGMPDGLPDADEDSILSTQNEPGKVVVPYGHVWVEGDNERKSWDSRDIGPISKGLIVGKAVGVWRGWTEVFGMRDARSEKEKEAGSRVVVGRSEVPSVFLE